MGDITYLGDAKKSSSSELALNLKCAKFHTSENCPLYMGIGRPRWLTGKDPACQADVGSIPGSRRYPGEGMATHSSIFAWEILWTEELGGL